MTRTKDLSRAELEDRRRAVLARLGASYEVIAERATAQALIGDEWAAWDELQEIEFLLGNDVAAE